MKKRILQFSILALLLVITCAIPLQFTHAASGTISATNCYVMIAGTYGSTTISWSASGCDTVQVYVNSDNRNDVLYSQGGPSGSGTPDWIERGRSHVFKLYAGTDRAELLDTITVIGVGSNSGTVGAREKYVAIPDNETFGTAEITFGVNGYNTGQVYVQMNSNPEQLWAQNPTGCGTPTWIQKGNTYTFRLYASTAHTVLLDTVVVYGISASPVESTIFDDDGDDEMSLGDRYEHLHPNDFFEHGMIVQDHISMVLSGLDNNAGFDYNNDDVVQENEFEDAAMYYGGHIYDVTYASVTALSVTARFYDKNGNGYITAGDHYKYTYSNGDVEQGKVKQELLSAVTVAQYDYNNLITAAEIRNYLNAKTVHTWTVYLYGALSFPNVDVYSMVTDYNADGCVSLGERYIHYTYSGTTVTNTERGYITQDHINMVINGGFDNNPADGKVQPAEYEAAAEYYTGDDWELFMAPKIVDTQDYWPTDMGNMWEYENWQYSSRKSWVHIIEGHNPDSNLDAYFTKNHTDTYWGLGQDWCYRMGLNWGSGLLYISSTSNYYSAFDGNPDAIIYHTSTAQFGQTRSWYWNVRLTYQQIPYIVFPISLDVDNASYSYSQGYYHTEFPSQTDYTDSGAWAIWYEWFYIKTDIGYEGPALHLLVNEPDSNIYEDWYFVEGLGMIRIEQYTDSDRDTLTVKVDVDKLILK